MNFYAVLDNSDDEDTPKVVTKSAVKAGTEKTQVESKKPTGAPPATKSNDSKLSAPKDKSTAPRVDKEKNPRSKENTAPRREAAPGDPVVDKGGERQAGGHGSKQHRENRDRPRRAGGDNPEIGERKKKFDRKPRSEGGGRGPKVRDTEATNAEGDEGAVEEAEYAEAEVEAIVPEPEPVTFTLDEYLAKRNAARSNLDAFVAVKERTVEATVDGVKVDNALGDYFANGQPMKSTKTKEVKAKTVIAIDLLKNATEKPQDREERGSDRDNGRGRAGNQGGSSSAGRFNGRPSRSSVKIDISDKSAFPTLG